MAYTQADITALEKAIAIGAARARIGERDVQYRSLAEMRDLLAEMKRQVNATPRTRMIRVTSVKGFQP